MDVRELRGELAELPCFNLYIGWRRMQAFYGRYLDEGLNPQRVYVLELLLAHGSLGVTQLAAALDVEVASMSGLLARMDREGLVERPRAAESRRERRVALTKEGRRVAKRTEAAVAEADEALMARLSESDVRALVQLVEDLGGLTR